VLSAIVSQQFPHHDRRLICGRQDFLQRWKHDIRSAPDQGNAGFSIVLFYELVIYVNLFSVRLS
jgi:hypothetical protein